MYSPKIQKDLISNPCQMAKSKEVPMTAVVDKMIRPQTVNTISTQELQSLLCGHKILLDCGHVATVGHNFANTVIIISLGGGRIKTVCHECGY